MFCLVGVGVFRGDLAFAGVNDFYFKDFTGDYYLSRNEDGTSRLKVIESLTAVFPDFNQNKGICRQISFTNQGGANITLPNLTKSDLKLTRNGVDEPIYSISKEDNYYNVCTGTDEYVLGEQVYVFEYEFKNVVTEFENNGQKWQELYWDTNGNGAMQRFDSVTARVHFIEPEVFSGKSWCYVGKYGESGQERCTISSIDDGIEFTAQNLKSKENLTFDVELLSGSFVVIEPEENYIYLWLMVIVGGICLVFIGRFFRKYLKSLDKKNYYKGIFVKPEYQPSEKYGLTEMTEIYLEKKKDVKVAMLLEVIVKKKVELKKGEKKKWSLVVNDLDGLGKEYIDLLAILNGGKMPEVGDIIEIKRQVATSKLVKLQKSIDDEVLSELKRDKLVEDKYHIGGSKKRGVGNVIAMTIIIVPVVVMMGVFLMGIIEEWLGLDQTYGMKMMFYEHFYLIVLIMIVLTTVVCVTLSDMTQRYMGHTKEGLKESRYMDGLRLYIEMAEADRMKMLQSVEGADTSAEGIVKLYEKLLPYAAVFGLEESWMKEMKEYCKVEEIEEPNYLLNGLAISEISRGLHNAASYATAASTMSSSGGGSSSGFSGGGGGGFSGGGGGGGGFSGR